MSETPNERFERLAEAFYRETGFMAPGKSVAPEMAYSEERERERFDRWDTWIKARAAVSPCSACGGLGGERPCTTCKNGTQRGGTMPCSDCGGLRVVPAALTGEPLTPDELRALAWGTWFNPEIEAHAKRALAKLGAKKWPEGSTDGADQGRTT